MQGSFLTIEDKEFLAQFGEASRLGFDFMFHDLFRKVGPASSSVVGAFSNEGMSLISRAHGVPIWFKGGIVLLLKC